MVDRDTMVEVLVTGGAGFIGSNFVLHALTTHPDWRITTLDKLTYAGRMENLRDVMSDPRHRFVQGDVTDAAVAGPLVRDAEIIVHFAAETHVDRSLHEAGAFITTDVYGSFVLLDAARLAPRLRRFVQISTDEVYGSVDTGSSTETDEVKPRNPYAASKAVADRLAYSYWATYGVPVIITRASNNYGPRQFPEKVVPLFVTNAIDQLPLPLYGDGLHVRDWLHVEDHCLALDLLIDRGENGEVYNIGGRQRGPERQADPSDPGASRPAALAHRAGLGPAGSRPTLLARHNQAAGARLAPAAPVPRRAARDGLLVSGQRLVVATDQGGRPGLSRVLPDAIRRKQRGTRLVACTRRTRWQEGCPAETRGRRRPGRAYARPADAAWGDGAPRAATWGSRRSPV